MANELYSQVKLTGNKNGAKIALDTSITQSMTGNEFVQSTQSIGTVAETLSLGEISGAPAKIAIKNLDPTNFVEIGGDSGLTVFKIQIVAGDTAIFCPSAVPLYGKADTASVRVLIVGASA